MTERRTSTLAIRGTKWIALGAISQRTYQFVTMIILARILMPTDFGLVAIALMTINIIARLKEAGMTSALISRKEGVQQAANAFFIINCILSTVVYAAIFAASPYIAGFFKNDLVAPLLKIMSLNLFIEATSVVQNTLAVKAMQFKKQSLITFCDSAVNGSISVVLALKGLGIWALAYGYLAGTICASILWWYFSSWRPSLNISSRITWDMLRFGISLFITASLDRTIDTLNRAFIGRLLGVGPLGYYDFTARVIHMPFRNIISISNRVALPAFCEVQEKIDLIKQWYLKMIGFSCLLMAPISVCLFVLPGYFVPVIYGEKWLIAVPLIKIMAVFAFIMPFLYSWPVYVSTGRADLVLKFTAVRLLITTPLLFWAARTSLSAVCLVEMISGCVFASINFQIVTRLINITRRQIAKSIRAPLTGTAIFTVFLLTVKHVESRFNDTPSWISLLIILLPAIASYIVTIFMCSPETVSDLKKVIGISFGLGEKGLSEH